MVPSKCMACKGTRCTTTQKVYSRIGNCPWCRGSGLVPGAVNSAYIRVRMATPKAHRINRVFGD